MKPKTAHRRHPGARPARRSEQVATSVQTVRIESLAADGRGLARLSDKRVAFVAGGCPGDELEVELESRPSKVDARTLRVITPSELRVEPVCEVVKSCGGCDWMHVASRCREESHAEIVRALLAHAMGRDGAVGEATGRDATGRDTTARDTADGADPAPREALPRVTITAAPAPLGYRTRARLHLRVDRRGLALGYLAPRSHEVVDVRTCVVLDPRLDRALCLLRELLSQARGSGEVQLALGQGERPVIDLAFRGDVPPSLFADLDRLSRGDDAKLAGARVALEGVQRPASFGDPAPVQRGPDELPIVLAPGGFGQPSDEGAALLARRVADLAGAAGKNVVELFSGSGTLSVLLARDAASFIGVEIDEAASRAAKTNLDARGLAHKLVVADADAYEIPRRTDVVVLDPPRTGARGAVLAITAARTKRVVYVSCDPATLARDVRSLASGGYAIESIDTLELFPQTSHVESIVVLTRARAGR